MHTNICSWITYIYTYIHVAANVHMFVHMFTFASSAAIVANILHLSFSLCSSAACIGLIAAVAVVGVGFVASWCDHADDDDERRWSILASCSILVFYCCRARINNNKMSLRLIYSFSAFVSSFSEYNRGIHWRKQQYWLCFHPAWPDIKDCGQKFSATTT